MTASLLLAASLVAAPAQPAPAPVSSPPVVAEHRGIIVTLDDVRDLAYERARRGDPRGMMQGFTVDGRVELVRELVEQRVLAREARRVGLDRDANVARRLTRVADGVLAESLVAQVRDTADVSEPALRAFYTASSDRFRTAPRRRMRHILVASEADARAAADAVRAGQAFADVASARSLDQQTRAQGGSLGWVPQGVMVKAFDAAAFALSPGQVSGPVQTSFGWHVIQVDEIDPGTLPPFELIADQVKETLLASKVEALTQRLVGLDAIAIDRAVLESLK